MLGTRGHDATTPSIPFFCRALYDYDPRDSSGLSFRQNDMIEILGKDPSGWWDGLLGNRRGWVPSNYVAIISGKDALEVAFVEREKTPKIEAEGLENPVESNDSAGSSDFWMPELTSDGRIHYVNTRTGQRAQDLPDENDGDIEVALGLKRYRPNTSVDESTVLSSRVPSAQPSYLPSTYSLIELVVDPDGSVRAGTVPALVEHLTTHQRGGELSTHTPCIPLRTLVPGIADPRFIKSFLMTFKTFTTVDHLFDLLVHRFWIQPPPKLAQNERGKWGELNVIQNKVLNTFRSMVVDDDILDKDDMCIFHRMQEFLMTEEVARFPAARQLLGLLEQHAQSADDMVITPQLRPLLLKSSRTLKLLDIEPLDLAQQLSIMESQLYRRIRPMECFQRTQESRTENVDNITIFIQTNSKIGLWVADSILSEEDLRRRTMTVEHLISVADHCRSLNNFSTLAAMIAGLDSPPIRRLKRTWAQVSRTDMVTFTACEKIISSNKAFLEYRSLMRSVIPPCVPFIGISLSNLQSIRDGFPDNTPSKDSAGHALVNFRKRQKAYEVIDDMRRWRVPYDLRAILSIQTYIEESLHSMSEATEPAFWSISLERESGDDEDEKMAHMLQESGFF
ncbi:hypothetical protein MVEN_00416700 [Mycena venus]|uniref:Ras GEF n=1 Tax=Mycena venus TaxID=2733690 RepID=A0A8H6YV32_9AGAR|nr:hypothetical protein MVEN_00416700 [Mycena venus]